MTQSTVTHDTFVIVRTYGVPVEHEFRAWADPVRKACWFAGSADALGTSYELDFLVGGGEVNRGGPPEGPEYIYAARFRDIVIDQRIVYTSTAAGVSSPRPTNDSTGRGRASSLDSLDSWPQVARTLVRWKYHITAWYTAPVSNGPTGSVIL